MLLFPIDFDTFYFMVLNERVAEGVVKYRCDFEQRDLPPEVLDAVSDLDHWRQIFFHHDLIGQDPNRYGGFGFGNLSKRLDPRFGRFIITATQTSGLSELLPAEHYSVIEDHEIESNSLTAYGHQPPSSEALTHAAIYEADFSIRAVFHAHHPVIWQATEGLAIPATRPNVAYGTPQMAQEMTELLIRTNARELGIISMLGHQDGVITFGETTEETGQTMLDYLDRSSS